MESLNLDWPLMSNNISKDDLDNLIEYLKQDDPRLTNGPKVEEFEEQWSQWLGCKYSIFVNSGSSANIISMAILKELYPEGGEIIIPPLTWVSDITSVIFAGFTPVFVDINVNTLGLDTDKVLQAITSKTKAVFISHIMGYNALTNKLLHKLQKRNIKLIEDVCESTGATFRNQKLGTFGEISNFSFYFAHHMSTIEGGMIRTNKKQIYEMARVFRSHGLIRESLHKPWRDEISVTYSDLTPDFTFMYPAYNMRSTELNAVLGLSQLEHLDIKITTRQQNLKLFLKNLNPEHYKTDFRVEGSSNYALTIVPRNSDLTPKIEKVLQESKIEYRRGLSGGGNQLRQPYLKRLCLRPEQFEVTDYLHFNSFYIGNYPTLNQYKIVELCKRLNIL